MRGRNSPLALSIHSDGRLRAHSWYLVPRNVYHARIRIDFHRNILEWMVSKKVMPLLQ